MGQRIYSAPYPSPKFYISFDLEICFGSRHDADMKILFM